MTSASTAERVGPAFAGARGERLAQALLAILLVVAGALLLYLNRDTSFWNDELTWFGNLAGPNNLESLLIPHNSHLIATTRVVYLLTAEVAGPEYLVMRLLGMASVLVAGALFFVWAKRRIGPGWALLPATLLLFYGSAWQHVVGPIGFTVIFSIALGLGALVALDSPGRGRELLACALLTLSVLTYTVGLAYLVGVAVSVLLRRDRLRRAWIFLIPLLLYAAWWIWAREFDQDRTEAGNLLHVIEFFGRSMAANAGGITGLNIPGLRIFGPEPATEGAPGALGWIAGAVLTIALIWRIVRGGLPRSFWASLGVLVTFWLAAALADIREIGSQAAAIRYYFPGSSALLLVLVDAVSGMRIHSRWAVALLAAFAFSLAMNVVFLFGGAAYLREQGRDSRIELAMVELRAGLEPGADGPQEPEGDLAFGLGPAIPKGTMPQYPAAVARYGSPALSLDEIRALPAALRVTADSALASAGGASILPLADAQQPVDPSPCRSIGGSGPVELQPGTHFVRPSGTTPLAVTAQRFSNPPGIPLGTVPPGRWSLLVVTPDRAPEPWVATITPDAIMTVCGISQVG